MAIPGSTASPTSLPPGHPAFQQLVDARRLVANPQVMFSTPEARKMLGGLIAIIDQQQRAVLQFERSLWDGGKRFGLQQGMVYGVIIGFIVGWLIGRLL